MYRARKISYLQEDTFDVCIIGGGASGTGAALDAALRGMKVALIERQDFAAETSSKSTKLIHGGVRYLEMAFKNFDFGQLKQVRHGLEERHILLSNAPHLAHPLALITPVFSWIEGFYYTIGLKLYGFFAKNDPLPQAQWLNKKEAFEQIPTLSKRTHSAVMYYDGQLDDARFALALAQTAQEKGAMVLNHARVVGFEKENDKITEARIKDEVSGQEFTLKAKVFLNCTGPFADSIRQLANSRLPRIIAASKGVHITLPKEVLNSTHAMLIPKTTDGRVMYALPFEGEVMIGTTDEKISDALIEQEQIVSENDISLIINSLKPYLEKPIDPKQIKAGFGGLRPLIKSGSKESKKLVRDHEIETDSASGLVSLMGGKWTTYRLMAKDAIDTVAHIVGNAEPCTTEREKLVGAEGYNFEQWQTLCKGYGFSEATAQHLLLKYGSLAEEVANLTIVDSSLAALLSPKYPYIQAEVVYAVQEEMACSIRDVLARRIRLEMTDWQTCINIAPTVANLMASILGWTDAERDIKVADYEGIIKKLRPLPPKEKL